MGAPVLLLDPERRLAHARLRLDRGLSISDEMRAKVFEANGVALRELAAICERIEEERSR